MRDFMLAFIPLFAAVNPVGTIPMFLNLTKNLSEQGDRLIEFSETKPKCLTD